MLPWLVLKLWNSISAADSPSKVPSPLPSSSRPRLTSRSATVFTRALQSLSRIGDDLDFSCTSFRLSISTVNSSRTAFGIVHFYPRFFGLYEVQGRQAQRDDSVETYARSPREKPFKFSLAGKVRLYTESSGFLG